MIPKELLCCAILLFTVQISGNLVFLHHPEGVSFIGNETINYSEFPDIGLTLLGLTPRENFAWKGMSIKSPLKTAEVLIVLAVEGAKTLDKLSGHHFPLNCDKRESTTLMSLGEDLSTRYQESLWIKFDLEDGRDYGQSTLEELNCTSMEGVDKPNDEFEKALHLLDCVKHKNPTVDKKILIWLVIPSLNPTIESQDTGSKDFKSKRDNLLEKIRQSVASITNQKVILVALTSCSSPTDTVRNKRATNETEKVRLIPGTKYDSNYPIMFNIFLWFAVAFIFSLIAICVTIADMDPGRDSIIYRMTSNRMKKDN